MRVLVIDDDELARESYAAALAARGHLVDTAEGRSARQMISSRPPDAIVVDILMPDVDGIELIVEAQRHASPPRIVAVSGGGRFSAEHCLTMAENLGANISLRKPVNPEALVSAVESPADLAATPSAPGRRTPLKARILAVDDDPLVLDLLALYLAEHEVRTARGGEEALNILSFARPHLILLDVKMPTLDGVQTLRRIRARPKLADTRVMMLTAAADRSTINQAVAAGADGYMLKPFRRPNLIQRVNRLLKDADTNVVEV